MDLKRAILGNICLVLIYYLAAQLTSMLSLPPSGAMPLWAPAGIALGAVLIWGYRLLPGVFVGGFTLISVMQMGNESSLMIMGIAYGLQALLYVTVSRLLLTWFGVWPSALVREFDIIKFFLLSAFVASIVPALFIVAIELKLGIIASHAWLDASLTWWIGWALGTVIFTPVILVLFAQPRAVWQTRLVSVALPMLVLFVLADILLMITRDNTLANARQEFESNVNVVHEIIRSELDYDQLLLRSMHAYFKNS